MRSGPSLDTAVSRRPSPLVLLALLGLAAAGAYPRPAAAQLTLAGAAEPGGRYFGTAIGSWRLSDTACTDATLPLSQRSPRSCLRAWGSLIFSVSKPISPLGDKRYPKWPGRVSSGHAGACCFRVLQWCFPWFIQQKFIVL